MIPKANILCTDETKLELLGSCVFSYIYCLEAALSTLLIMGKSPKISENNVYKK